MLEKVDELKRQVIIGETLLVPCIIQGCNFTPVINHPHNDIENGQPIPHYHADIRFIQFGQMLIIKHNSRNYFLKKDMRVDDNKNLQYLPLDVVRHQYGCPTPLDLIKYSKIKHKCIYRGKCGHRGYDLTNVQPDENNIIKCPLHGLKYHKDTGEMIELQKKYFKL